MSEGVVQRECNSSLEETVRLMREHGIRRIPLVEDQEPVGLLTLHDLVIDNRLKFEIYKPSSSCSSKWEHRRSLPENIIPSHVAMPPRTRALMRAGDQAEQPMLLS
jgi:CBS-domain-containing membrane protein